MSDSRYAECTQTAFELGDDTFRCVISVPLDEIPGDEGGVQA